MTRDSAATIGIRRAVASSLQRWAVTAQLVDPPRVLVACSGGADSMALTAATLWQAHSRNPAVQQPVSVVVVDHGWWPESAQHSEQVAERVRDLGATDVVVERVRELDADPAGPEAAARAQRYAALERVRIERGAHVILLGHTLQDQAEQVLLGLVRGSGARSLAGMPEQRDALLRPLLQIPRADTEASCADLGIPIWQDPANRDPQYARVRVRELLQDFESSLGPGVAQALVRTAGQLRQDANALELWAQSELLRATDDAEAVDVDVLRPLPEAVRRRVLLAWLRDRGAPAGALAAAHVAAVDELITHWHGQAGLNLPGRLVIRRECGKLRVYPQ